jgi:hypothetical protein
MKANQRVSFFSTQRFMPLSYAVRVGPFLFAVASSACTATEQDPVENAEKAEYAYGTDAGGDASVASAAAEAGVVGPTNCGASIAATSTGANQALTISRNATKTLATLGAGQVGSASFRLQVPSCADYYGGHHYARFEVFDGNGTMFQNTFGTREYQNLVLPVTIKATGITESGYFYGAANDCPVTALLESVAYTTTKVSCLDSKTITAKFQNVGSQPLQKLAENVAPGTTVTFSAQAKFFDNYRAPSCAQILIAGRTSSFTLSRAKPATDGVVQLDAPLRVSAIPTCQSSLKSPAENATADFALDVSKIALGPTK